jgi:hypothetical protein
MTEEILASPFELADPMRKNWDSYTGISRFGARPEKWWRNGEK